MRERRERVKEKEMEREERDTERNRECERTEAETGTEIRRWRGIERRRVIGSGKVRGIG